MAKLRSSARWCKTVAPDSRLSLLDVNLCGTVSRLDYTFSCGPTSHAASACCRAFPFIHSRLASRIAPFGHLGTTRPGNLASQRFEQVLRETQFAFVYTCVAFQWTVPQLQSCETCSGIHDIYASA